MRCKACTEQTMCLETGRQLTGDVRTAQNAQEHAVSARAPLQIRVYIMTIEAVTHKSEHIRPP